MRTSAAWRVREGAEPYGAGIEPELDRVIAEAATRRLPEPTPRRSSLALLPGKIDALVGMRRSGKTWRLFQVAHDLEARGIGSDRQLYVNFEDDRLPALAPGDLRRIPEAFFRRHPASRGEECWFLFDEIQAVKGWETFLRRMCDEGHRLVVTGSSARLLSREIATNLRGRSLATELLPFSFAECLDHQRIPIPQRWPTSPAERSLLANRLEAYLAVGGFPEVQSADAETRVRILQDYLDVVLLRDVAERNRISNTTALRYLARRLLRSPAALFSVHQVHRELRSQGIAVGKAALHEQLGHVQDAFLAFAVERRSPSIKQRQVNARKTYAIDPGLVRACSPRSGPETGHLLENVVYLELRRRGGAIDYYVTESGWEVDFVVAEPGGGERLVQACASVREPRTREREVRALDEAMRELRLDEGWIVTLHDEEEIEVDAGRIHVHPAWRWLLEGTRPVPPSPVRVR